MTEVNIIYNTDVSGRDKRMKVMIVGQENVGKTSLVLALKQLDEKGRKKKDGIFTRAKPATPKKKEKRSTGFW